MVNAIHISDNRGETLELKLVDPYTHGIVVQNIEGLGYPQTNPSSFKLNSYDIGLFKYQEVDSRNIVLTLGMIGAPSVEGSRHLLYEFLPIRTEIELEIATDQRVGLIRGYVETITPDIFSSQEAVQVSIICLDPYIYTGGSEYGRVMSSHVPNFRFDKWFTDNKKPVGTISNKISEYFNSRFQNPKGFKVVIHAKNGGFDTLTLNHNLGSITLNDRVLNPYSMGTDPLPNSHVFFQQYDDIIIQNDMSRTSIILYRNGVYSDLLGKIEEDYDDEKVTVYEGANIYGDFPQLSVGYNKFELTCRGYKTIYGNIMARMNGEPLLDELNSYNKLPEPYDTIYGCNVDTKIKPFSELRMEFFNKIDVNNGIHARWKILDAMTDESTDTATNGLFYQDDDTGYKYRYKYGVNFRDPAVVADYWRQDSKGEWITYGPHLSKNLPAVNDKNVFECDDYYYPYNKVRVAFYFVIATPGVDGYDRARLLTPVVEILDGSSPYLWARRHLEVSASVPSNYVGNVWANIYSIETELSTPENPILEGYEYTSTIDNVDLIISYDDLYEAM